MPWTIHIDPSNICNFKCRYCYNAYPELTSKSVKEFMSLDGFIGIIDQLESLPQEEKPKVLRLFHAGEPLLNPNFRSMLEYMGHKNIAGRIELTTNASLMSKDMADSILCSGINYVRCSIYAVTDKKEYEITGNGISVDKIYENIKYLKEERDRRKQETPYIVVKTFNNLSEGEREIWEKRYSLISDEIYLDEITDLNGVIDLDEIKKCFGKKVCPYPFYMMVIKPNGDATVCCTDANSGFTAGNVFEKPIKEVWQGEKMHLFQKEQLMGNRKNIPMCSKCDMILNDKFTVDNIDNADVNIFMKRVKNKEYS
ncbi:MAG: SPASM domain-containing protein [Lachnospiraceae bacterium]|nr:SPASM domain-containing protein [Lachnospiraceae bacterium]